MSQQKTEDRRRPETEPGATGEEPGPVTTAEEDPPVVDGTDPEVVAVPEEAPVGASRASLTRRIDNTTVLAAAVAVLLVALVGALVVTWSHLRTREATDTARTQSLTAARVYAVELASYDYHHLDQDFGAVLANSTPAFAKSFTQSSNALKSVLSKYQATAAAKVVAAGVESSSTSHSVVLVFLDQTVTNTTQKSGPTTDHSRLEISLRHVGGRWAIDQVHLL